MIGMKLEGEVRIPSGCAIAALISTEGKRVTGEKIIESMKPMHDRSNGLGGGFAAYGIYPEYKEFLPLFSIKPTTSSTGYPRSSPIS